MPVAVGEERDVVILEPSRRNPNDGVARIDGLVTFVPNTKVGDRVRIRITRLGARHAEAEVLEVLGEGAAPTPRRGKPVAVGEEHDVTITEIGSRGDGLTRIEGYVVFVPGTQRGERVRIRITRVGDRAGEGEVVRRLSSVARGP